MAAAIAKDYADPLALLEYDPAGVVIRATGNAALLHQLDSFATSLKYYVDMMKGSALAGIGAGPPAAAALPPPAAPAGTSEQVQDDSCRPEEAASNGASKVPAAEKARNRNKDKVPEDASSDSDNDSSSSSSSSDSDSDSDEEEEVVQKRQPRKRRGKGNDGKKRQPRKRRGKGEEALAQKVMSDGTVKIFHNVRDAGGRFTSKKKKEEEPATQTAGEPVCDRKTAGLKRSNEERAEDTPKRQRRTPSKFRSSNASDSEEEQEEEESSTRQSTRSVDPSQPTLPEKLAASPLQHSVGVARKLVSRHFRDLGLSARCAHKVVSKQKDGKSVSHLVFRHDKIEFPFAERQNFEWRVEEGRTDIAMAVFLDPARHSQEEVPVFLSAGCSGAGKQFMPHTLHYVGHYQCASFEKKDHVYEGIPRKAILNFKFVGFHKTLSRKMAELANS